MKRILFTGLTLLVLLAAVLFAYLELAHGETEVLPTELTVKEVQAKCPEVILTGRDKTFAAAALDFADIREFLGTSEEEINVHTPGVELLVAEYYPEMSDWLLTVTGSNVMLEGKLAEDNRIYLQFANVMYLRKLSAHYREKGKEQVVTTLYENLNGETYQQYMERRVWFSYWKK